MEYILICDCACADANGEQCAGGNPQGAAERVGLCDPACAGLGGHHQHAQPLGAHAHAQGQVIPGCRHAPPDLLISPKTDAATYFEREFGCIQSRHKRIKY